MGTAISQKGTYRARFAETEADILATQRLRFAVFNDGAEGLDSDKFDAVHRHVMVERICDNQLMCSFRFLHVGGQFNLDQSYSAQFYDLGNLDGFQNDLLEVGRFCVDPGINDPQLLRVAWSVITAYVDEHDIGLLFGCSSFEGLDPAPYKDAFALLKVKHLAPDNWAPRPKAPKRYDFAQMLEAKKLDLKRAQQTMPPLLRTYLTMGGWVSDHAVVDTQMNTLHVFTGVEIAAIPPNRKRLLRADVA